MQGQEKYKIGSTAMLRVHKRTIHKDIGLVQKENIVEDKIPNANSGEKRKSNKQPNKYISKRIKCELCEKKFNKETTYKKHMDTIHVGMNKVANTSKDEPSSSTSIELNLSNELTLLTLPYDLRNHRGTQKQCQAVLSPSV